MSARSRIASLRWPRSRPLSERKRSWVALSLAASFVLVVSLWALPAKADELARREQEKVSGIDRPARYHSDTGKDVGNVFLFVPRHLAKFLFWSASVAIGVLEKQPIVPRAQEVVSTKGGRFAVLPTVFAETHSPFDVGARMIADFGNIAAGLRVGFGGVHYFEIEPRLAFQFKVPIRSIVSLEGLYRVDNSRLYLGVGQTPATDSRNRFHRGQAGVTSRFFEERARWIAAYALRLNHDFEISASGSFDRRSVSDAYGAPDVTLSKVFLPGSVVGAFETRWTGYAEGAVRFDTRPTRGRPSAGILGEAYIGTGHQIGGEQSTFLRTGGRLAAFIPIYRRTNILSPRIVLDAIDRVGSVPLSFEELAGEPDFRGFDERRDNLSLVGSIDYRWLIIEHVAASVFSDSQVVAKDIQSFDFKALRWVAGAALDLHTDDVTLGQVSIAAGTGGFRVSLAIGVSTGYGDRQHRR